MPHLRVHGHLMEFTDAHPGGEGQIGTPGVDTIHPRGGKEGDVETSVAARGAGYVTVVHHHEGALHFLRIVSSNGSLSNGSFSNGFLITASSNGHLHPTHYGVERQRL